MGGLGFVDPTLLDLSDRGDLCHGPIYQLAMTQYTVHITTGHMLSTNDAYVRQKVRAASDVGLLPEVSLRCLMCGAAASLDDWSRGAMLPDEKRFQVWEQVRQAKGEASAQFLHECDGPARAQHMLDVLRTMSEGDWWK